MVGSPELDDPFDSSWDPSFIELARLKTPLLGGIDVSTSILSPDADIVVGECTTLDASVTGDRGPENSGSELGGKEAALVILSGNSIAGRGVDDKT